MTGKYCVNCKYFKSNMIGSDIRDDLATCSFFNIKKVETINLVTGYPDEYHCSTARFFKHLCGPSGLKYVEK